MERNFAGPGGLGYASESDYETRLRMLSGIAPNYLTRPLAITPQQAVLSGWNPAAFGLYGPANAITQFGYGFTPQANYAAQLGYPVAQGYGQQVAPTLLTGYIPPVTPLIPTAFNQQVGIQNPAIAAQIAYQTAATQQGIEYAQQVALAQQQAALAQQTALAQNSELIPGQTVPLQAVEPWSLNGPFVGVGPRSFKRSDENIKDEINSRLTQHGQLDASDIDVKVSNGEVTLSGTVHSRYEKRLVEDVVEFIAGVKDVHNQLHIRRPITQQMQQSGRTNEAMLTR
jgi:osmotically-inducible protein OsmY